MTVRGNYKLVLECDGPGCPWSRMLVPFVGATEAHARELAALAGWTFSTLTADAYCRACARSGKQRARALGLVIYHGTQCKYGHPGERYSCSGRCVTCARAAVPRLNANASQQAINGNDSHLKIAAQHDSGPEIRKRFSGEK